MKTKAADTTAAVITRAIFCFILLYNERLYGLHVWIVLNFGYKRVRIDG